MSSKYIKFSMFVVAVLLMLSFPKNLVYANGLVTKAPQTGILSPVTRQIKVLAASKDETRILSNEIYYGNKRILIIGDSLSVGWDGTQVLKDNYPTVLKRLLNPKTLNNSFSSAGSQIAGNNNGTPIFDLSNNVSRILKGNTIKNTDIIVLEIGINDLDYSRNNLGYVQQKLQANIQRLRNANPTIKIFGILPVTSYMPIKQSNYAIDQLKRALTDVYFSFGIPVINVTDFGVANYPSDLGDKLVHPNQTTYRQMAKVISHWMTSNYIMLSGEHDSKQLFSSNGWQKNESNQWQYAVNNVLQSDYHEINGRSYYFDPKTKALVTNRNIKYLGNQWYADKTGVLLKR
ncbi:SGNH/GDSL hydrolase family protein [Weissella hellenica]|uniref:SGNH/GDSL hydrolase family protein n=1 Tax=Weissella hellenica TaxID=46256 RepID=UPI003888668E